jgi:hypothetical protein
MKNEACATDSAAGEATRATAYQENLPGWFGYYAQQCRFYLYTMPNFFNR